MLPPAQHEILLFHLFPPLLSPGQALTKAIRIFSAFSFPIALYNRSCSFCQEKDAHSFYSSCTWNFSGGQKVRCPSFSLKHKQVGGVFGGPTCRAELFGLLPENLIKYLYELLHLKRSGLPSIFKPGLQ